MTADALAHLVLEAVMRGIFKLLPEHVDASLAKHVTPLAEQVGQVQTGLEKIAHAHLQARAASDELIAKACAEFSTITQKEISDAFGTLRIESDADGFLFVTAAHNAIRAPLGFRPFQYHGKYVPGSKYNQNDAVTCRGSLWMARGAVANIAPGTDEGAAHWTLAVKCGKDLRADTSGGRGE